MIFIHWSGQNDRGKEPSNFNYRFLFFFLFSHIWWLTFSSTASWMHYTFQTHVLKVTVNCFALCFIPVLIQIMASSGWGDEKPKQQNTSTLLKSWYLCIFCSFICLLLEPRGWPIIRVVDPRGLTKELFSPNFTLATFAFPHRHETV